MCNFNYATNQGICTQHSFPLTRSQAKLQKKEIPSLFKGGRTVSGSKQRQPSLLRDAPAVPAGKKSTALPPADLGTSTPKKRGSGRPPLHRVEQAAPIIPAEEPNVFDDINETLPTIYLVRKRLRNRKPLRPAQPTIVQPDALLTFDEDQTALKQIEAHNIQDNRILTRRTIPATNKAHYTIPMVIEDRQPVDMDRHFPRLCPLT